MINVSGLKKKRVPFIRVFTAAWSTFVEGNPSDDTDDNRSEIQKILTCGSEAIGFAIDQRLGFGKA